MRCNKLIEDRIYSDEEIPAFMLYKYMEMVTENKSFILNQGDMWELLQVVQNVQLHNKFNSQSSESEGALTDAK